MAALASRVYTVSLTRATITTAITIIQIVAGATVPLQIIRVECGQDNSTTSTQQMLQLNRKSAAATVTSFTPIKNGPTTDPSASAVGGTAATGTTATAEGTDTNIIRQWVFNYLNSVMWLPSPQERVFVDPTGIIGVKFPTAPSSARFSADVVFEELG
jgi:hypothetical protein